MLGRLQRQQAETGTSTTPVKSVRVSNASSSVAGRIQRTQAETKPSASVVEQTPAPTETKKKTKVTKDDIGVGIGAAILRTTANMSSIGEKIIQAPLKLLGQKFDKKTAAEDLQSMVEKKTGKEEGTLFDPQNEAQEVTQALTEIGMYFLPGSAATKVGTAARVAETARVASLAAKGKKLTGLVKIASKAVPYLAEGGADALLSAPLVAAQSKGSDNIKKELAINSAIAVAAPGVLRVAGKGFKKLAGRLLRKGKVVEETIEQASKLADELVPAEKNVDELTKAKTALNESIEGKPMEIPGKGNTIQNGAEMAARQADNVAPKVEGRIQRAAEETKPTKFAQTVAKSEITEPELAKKLTDLEPRYSTVTNPETQAKALNRIATEGTERAASYVRNAVNVDADVTATGVELITKYQAEKSFDLAADIAVDVSEKLSKAGQAIQAAKIYENLSPEAVLVRAQKFIAEQNSKDVLFAGKRKLTEADAESLYEIAKKMQTLNGEAKTELAAEIGGILGSYKRASIGKKLSSIQTQAQLLNPKTFARNIIGNELFYRLERITKLIATPIDIARSKLTGTERTITFKTGNQEKFWKNWITGTKAGWKGIDIGPNTVYDIKNHTFKNKLNPFYWGEKAVGAMLKGFDFAAYKRAYGETLFELAYLKAKKEGAKDIKKRAIQLLDKMDAKAYELADQYGKYVTFQDDSLLAQGAVKLKKALNLGQDFGFGDLLLKYPRTPGNLLDRALDYSPVGFIKSFKTIAGPILFGTKKGIAQNREIAMATARAVVGSLGFTGFGYFLADKGMITGKRSSNKNVNALEEEMGRGEYKINVSAIKRFVMSGFQNTRIQDGDTYFTYDWAQPVSVALSIGANMNGGTGAGVVENIASGVNTLVEQPLLSGVLNFMKYGDVSKSITTTAEGVGASFTPTFLNQFRQYVDNVKRQTRGSSFLETSMNRIKNRIPGQSTDLAPQVGSLGNVKQVYENNNVFNVFLNPGNVTKYKEIPEAKLVLDLIEQTGEDKHAPKVIDKTATLFGRAEIITPLEQAAMQQYAGDQIMKSLNIAANSDQFKALSPEEQVDVISRKLTEIGSNVRNILMAKRAKEAKDANDTEAIQFMQENVSPTDAKRFNAAYQYLKENNPFEIRMPEKEEKKEELIDKVDKGALPALGVGLGLAIATKGKKTDLLEKGFKALLKRDKTLVKEVAEYATKIKKPEVLQEAASVFAKHQNRTEIFEELADSHFKFKEGKLVSDVKKTGEDTLRNRLILRTSELYNPHIDTIQKGSAYKKLTPALIDALDSLNIKPTKPITLYRSVSDPNRMSKENISYWTRSKASAGLYSDYAPGGSETLTAVVNPSEILFDTNLLTKEEKLLKYGTMTQFNESKEVLVRSKDVYNRLGTSVFENGNKQLDNFSRFKTNEKIKSVNDLKLGDILTERTKDGSKFHYVVITSSKDSVDLALVPNPKSPIKTVNGEKAYSAFVVKNGIVRERIPEYKDVSTNPKYKMMRNTGRYTDKTERLDVFTSLGSREPLLRKYLGITDVKKAEPLEEVKKLLATHQTTEEGLQGILKDKKIWGPSVAVFDKEKVKSKFGFGDYIVVMNKKAVDPSNKEVMMFTDDVFSPRMISSETSLKKLSKDIKAGKDILGGEITTGETPVHTYLAKRLKSYDELREASSKLGTREDAKNSYIKLYQTITEGFDELVPGEFAEVMGFSRLRDEAEGMVRELVKKNKFTPENFIKRMKSELSLNVDMKDATEYVNKVQSEMSTFKVEYFEAKILRGLDLAEIDTVLVPETASIELLTMLNKAGIRTEVYEKTNLSDAFKKVSSSAFGLGIIPFGFFNTNLLKKKLDALKSRKEELKKQNEELQMKVDEAIKQRNDTPAKITVYNPDPAQTDDTPHEGSFMTKMEFGDVAVGNRKEHDEAKQKFFKEKKDTFIIIPELAKIKTPYGYGKFRVRDTMNLRYDGQGRLDIFIPDGMEDIDKEIRKTPNGTYFYIKDKEAKSNL